jgi:hypothetical protein
MPGIFAVSNMESEFHPYLSISYLEHRDGQPSGVILQTKKRIIRKNYDFSESSIKKDLEDLRMMIWHYLVKDNNITDITDVNGCLKDFRRYEPNHVVQGWQARKRLSETDKCCKFIIDNLTDEVLRHNILREEYRLSGEDKQDRNICKKVRGEECGNNYPPNTPSYDRCMREVNWLCNIGYPVNKIVQKHSEIAKKIRTKLYHDLVKSNMKVNKKKFDEIIDAGLFQDLGNRMGNKVANYKNVRHVLDDMFSEKNYYLDLIENFNNKPQQTNVNVNFYILLIIILIVLWWMYSQKR